jgi:GTPase SAR1 family protein
VVGLDAAGKTTILHKLKLGDVMTTIPTMGLNIESLAKDGYELKAWDVFGQETFQSLYRYPPHIGSQAIIFVIDSSDRDRTDKAREELHRILNDRYIEIAPRC